MHIVLAKEIADVDASWFDKIGVISSDILVDITIDQTIALKGEASSSIDHLVECQNTLFLRLNVINDGKIGDSLEPGIVYRYTGKDSIYSGQDFVEIKYEEPLGRLTVVTYFLVPVVDCEFAIYDDSSGAIPFTLQELWRDGFIKRSI